MAPIDVTVFFNYRSPYCYLASKKLWTIEDDHGGRLTWKPLGGWVGRSPPDRAKIKVPLTRQDVARWARRMAIPFVPPPISTDPTRAAAGALLAIERGVIRPYTIAVMALEWGEGRDIGELDVLVAAGQAAGLDRNTLAAAVDDPARRATLDDNARAAEAAGAFGVPTFVIDDQLFWGQDRIDFVTEELDLRRHPRARD